jgi:hypothetical protein
VVNDNKDGVVIRGSGELLNEVHGDGIPWLPWNRELLEKSIWLMTLGFGAEASHAGFAE